MLYGQLLDFLMKVLIVNITESEPEYIRLLVVRNALVFSLFILTVQLEAAITYREDVYGRERRMIKHLEI